MLTVEDLIGDVVQGSVAIEHGTIIIFVSGRELIISDWGPPLEVIDKCQC